MDILSKYHRDKEFREDMKSIPYFKWPADWDVRLVPPFAGATVRFAVKIPNTNNDISVYLDMHEYLGFFGAPYWEIYPYKDDVYRVAMNDTDELLKRIEMIRLGQDLSEDES